MVKALKAQGLRPSRWVLDLRGRAERLGNLPATKSPQRQDPIPRQSDFYEPVFYPVIAPGGPSSSSRVWPRIPPKVNSVIVVPYHDEHGDAMPKLKWGD